MCKIMMFSGIKPDKVNLAWSFAEVAAGRLTATTDRDGFGYVAQTSTGSMFGERWLNTKDAFVNRHPITSEEQSFLEATGQAFYRPSPYNYFGDLTNKNDTVAIMLHARYSTNEITMANTHPHVYNDNEGKPAVALVHNGVINNCGVSKQLKPLRSTCDSEGILNEYVAFGVDEDPSNIGYVAKMLSGYYACGIMGTVPETGIPYMDVFKDNTAQLMIAYVEELECWVYCTNIGILEGACKDMRFNYRNTMYVRPGHLVRFNSITGGVLGFSKFNPEYDFKFADSGSVTEEEDNLEESTVSLPVIPIGNKMQRIDVAISNDDYPGQDEEIDAPEIERRIRAAMNKRS